MDAFDLQAGRDRRAFGAAFFLSSFGFEFLYFAMTVRVYDISRRAINVGAVTAIALLPKLLSPAYGLAVDRVGARRALAAASAATAALAAALAAARSLGWLYAVWFALSILFMVSANARTVLMTRIASGGGYAGANSLAFALMSAARLSAPFLAGLLAGRIGGGGGLMLAAAAVYAFGAAASLAVSASRGDGGLEAASGPDGPRPRGVPRVAARLAEGFSRIRSSSELKALVGVSAIRNAFLGFAPGLLVLVVTARLGRSSSDYGIAAAAAALGAFAGSLAGPRLAAVGRPGLVASLGLGLHFASYAALGFLQSFPLAIADLAAGGFALYASAVCFHARRDAATELATRGRVFGANTTIQTIPTLASLALGSLLADRFGPAPVYAVGGLLATAVLGAAVTCAGCPGASSRPTGDRT